jgi:MFS transporter, DHA1 family, multidrug resistance protein
MSLPSKLDPFFLNAFTWNLAHGMGMILVPLYAVDLGMSGVAIGSLVALPVFLQVIFNLIGGAYVDRLGAKNILVSSAIIYMLGSTVYACSTEFIGMMAGQCFYILARSTFWPASYALVSRMEGERNKNTGWLNSTTNGGQVTGVAVGGMLIGWFGFRDCFWISVGMQFVGLLLTFMIRRAGAPAARENQKSILGTYAQMIRHRAMYFGVLMGYVSVLPFTLSGSFYPVLLVSEGFSTQFTGWLMTLRALGSILSGLALARMVRSPTGLGIPMVCTVATAITIASAAATADPWLTGLSILGFGIASGLASIYFQLMISAVSNAEDRGAAISFGGLGWQVSNITTPLVMGVLMDGIGLREAFFFYGALALVIAALMPAIHRWTLAEKTSPVSR